MSAGWKIWQQVSADSGMDPGESWALKVSPYLGAVELSLWWAQGSRVKQQSEQGLDLVRPERSGREDGLDLLTRHVV